VYFDRFPKDPVNNPIKWLASDPTEEGKYKLLSDKELFEPGCQPEAAFVYFDAGELGETDPELRRARMQFIITLDPCQVYHSYLSGGENTKHYYFLGPPLSYGPARSLILGKFGNAI